MDSRERFSSFPKTWPANFAAPAAQHTSPDFLSPLIVDTRSNLRPPVCGDRVSGAMQGPGAPLAAMPMSRLDGGPTQNLAENKLFVGGAPPGCDEATLQAVRQPRLLHNPPRIDIAVLPADLFGARRGGGGLRDAWRQPFWPGLCVRAVHDRGGRCRRHSGACLPRWRLSAHTSYPRNLLQAIHGKYIMPGCTDPLVVRYADAPGSSALLASNP